MRNTWHVNTLDLGPLSQMFKKFRVPVEEVCEGESRNLFLIRMPAYNPPSTEDETPSGT